MKLAQIAFFTHYFSVQVIFYLFFSPISLIKEFIFFDIQVSFLRVDFLIFQ